MKITILGCGTSSGVPMIGCDCAVCRSDDPRNRRRRVSILAESAGTRLLIDTPPDLHALTDKSLDAHRKSVDRFKLLNRHDVEVAGTPATEVYFRGKRSGKVYKWIQTMFVSRNHKVYVLYSAPTNLYLRCLGDYDQLVRSIRLLP